MKIRDIIKFLIILLLFLSALVSFSQNMPILQKYKKTKVCDGYILWMGQTKCQLIDRKGNTLFNFPGNLVSFFDNKELIASHINNRLVTFDKNLDVIWKTDTSVHHELTNTPNNNILALSTELYTINNVELRFDVILCFDSSGKLLYKWSTYDQRKFLMNFIIKDPGIFRYKIGGLTNPDSVLFYLAPKLCYFQGVIIHELFHLNAIQEIPKNESENKDTVFRKGNILISFCNYNDSLASFLAIVDPLNNKILWHYVSKDQRAIHTPTMLPNGHILYYANSTGKIDNFSSVVEIDPITNEIIWEYTEKPVGSNCNGVGSCQRLPNGNTLISDCLGYIYEVTFDKKIVWKWVTNENAKTNSCIYRAYWYPKEKLKWLVNEE